MGGQAIGVAWKAGGQARSGQVVFPSLTNKQPHLKGEVGHGCGPVRAGLALLLQGKASFTLQPTVRSEETLFSWCEPVKMAGTLQLS